MKKHGMVITVEVPETEMPLPEEHAILLFQSVRELLNAWKYAKTGAAIVRLEKRDCELRIEVRDEGWGVLQLVPTLTCLQSLDCSASGNG